MIGGRIGGSMTRGRTALRGRVDLRGVVQNTYVASQEFNGKMAETRAQAALNWKSEFTIRDNALHFELEDSNGVAIPVKWANATFRRPVDDREDHTVALVREPSGGFSAVHRVPDGVWLVEIEADAGLAFPYRETLRLHAQGGTVQ